MTDYLEESLDNAGRLLEQVRRSERELSGLSGKNDDEKGSEDSFSPDRAQSKLVSEETREVNNEGETVNSEIKKVDDWSFPQETGDLGEKRVVNRTGTLEGELARLEQMSSGGENETSRTGTVPAAEVDRPEDGAVLAAQLEQMDRAAAVPAAGGQSGGEAAGRRGGYPVSPGGFRPGTVYPQAAGTPEDAQTPFEGNAAIRPAPGSDPGWAEQTDRAFRRDSRRYDGGFYLY